MQMNNSSLIITAMMTMMTSPLGITDPEKVESELERKAQCINL